MSWLKKLTGALSSEGPLRIDAETHERLANVHRGAGVAHEVAGEVLAELAPDDDSPLVLTWGEAVVIAAERLGAKLPN